MAVKDIFPRSVKILLIYLLNIFPVLVLEVPYKKIII